MIKIDPIKLSQFQLAEENRTIKNFGYITIRMSKKSCPYASDDAVINGQNFLDIKYVLYNDFFSNFNLK